MLGFRLIALDHLSADEPVAEALAVALPVPSRTRPELDL
jgi:hypothetical protein